MHLPLPLANAAAGVAPWLIAPFGLLLLLIAAMPLTPHRIKQVWEKYYPHIALGLGLFIAVWYVVMMPHGTAVVRHTVLEYVSFIALIGSLFVVAGGIHLKVKGSATPWENLRLLAIGAVVANLVGTTGASMVLIRPWLRMNQGRIRPYHVVFFIFIVSNCGGALTPIGDPPLFLGYLRGVPFFWLIGNVAGFWAMVVGALLAVFWWLDRREFKKQPAAMRRKLQEADSFRLDGKLNLLLLGLVIAAVFIVIAGLNAFEMIWLLTDQDPNTSTHTLGTFMVTSMFKDFQIGRATAIAVMLFLLVAAGSALLLCGLRREPVEH